MPRVRQTLRARAADLGAAVAFLTLLPVPGGGGSGRLARAAGWFPLVGAAVGAAGGAAAAGAAWIGLGPWLAAVFAVALQLALTGALHEDGLADTADGLGGGDRAARLAIMRDGAVGAYAVLALGAATAARVGAVAATVEAGWPVAAMAASGAVSRAAMVAVMHRLPHARDDGLAAAAGSPGRGALAQALLLAALCAVPLAASGIAVPLALAAGAAAAAAGVARLARRRLGGATGDVYGAAQTAAEALGLCAAAAALAHH